jgi:hypothetical protein
VILGRNGLDELPKGVGHLRPVPLEQPLSGHGLAQGAVNQAEQRRLVIGRHAAVGQRAKDRLQKDTRDFFRSGLEIVQIDEACLLPVARPVSEACQQMALADTRFAPDDYPQTAVVLVRLAAQVQDLTIFRFMDTEDIDERVRQRAIHPIIQEWIANPNLFEKRFESHRSIIRGRERFRR